MFEIKIRFKPEQPFSDRLNLIQAVENIMRVRPKCEDVSSTWDWYHERPFIVFCFEKEEDILMVKMAL